MQKIGDKLYYSKTTGTSTTKPPNLIRISLHSQSPLSWVFTKGSDKTDTTTVPANKQKPTLKIIERIQGPVHHEGNRKKLAAALRSGKLVGASDGSVKNGIGSHAWIITKKSKTHKHKSRIYGAGPVDGHPRSMNSTRAERAGFLGPLIQTLSLAQEYNITRGKLTMHVDNIGSYKKGQAPQMGDGTFRHVIADYDLKLHKSTLEYKLKTEHNVEVEYCHVKAHQDTKPVLDTKGKPLPLNQAAKLNIFCDKQAEKVRENPTPGHEPKINPEMASGTQVYFQSKGVTNVKNLYEQIHQHIHEDAQIDYLKTKKPLDLSRFRIGRLVQP